MVIRLIVGAVCCMSPVMLFFGWAVLRSAAAGDTFVCRKCGTAVRSEEVIWARGVPYCSHGCEL